MNINNDVPLVPDRVPDINNDVPQLPNHVPDINNVERLPCRCGSTDHMRSNSSHCILNKKFKTKK